MTNRIIRWAIVALLLGLVVSAAPAFAGEGQQIRRARGSRVAAPKASLLPTDAHAQGHTVPAAESPRALQTGAIRWPDGAALVRDDRAWALQEKKARIRMRLLLDLEQLSVSRGLDAERRAEVLFRLAETWMDQSRFEYLKARRTYERQMRDWEAGEASPLPVDHKGAVAM